MPKKGANLGDSGLSCSASVLAITTVLPDRRLARFSECNSTEDRVDGQASCNQEGLNDRVCWKMERWRRTLEPCTYR